MPDQTCLTTPSISSYSEMVQQREDYLRGKPAPPYYIPGWKKGDPIPPFAEYRAMLDEQEVPNDQ